MRSNISMVERSTYQVFDNIPGDYYTNRSFIKDFIERLSMNSYSHEEIMAGIIIACENRKQPDLCKLILEEVELHFRNN